MHLRNFKKRGRIGPLFVYINFSMELDAEIRKLAEAKLSPDQFLVDVLISARKGPKKVLIVVDGDNGINIEDCAEISRYVSKALDESGLIDDNYLLEVTSPGVEHPISSRRQYIKNIGRNLKVNAGGGVIEGKLVAVGDDSITLARETGSGKKKEIKTIEILLTTIEKAFVQVSFK